MIYILKASFDSYEDAYEVIILISQDKEKIEKVQKDLEIGVLARKEKSIEIWNKMSGAGREEKVFLMEELEKYSSISEFNGLFVEEYELDKQYDL